MSRKSEKAQELLALIKNSGNSDVDVDVIVDTMPVAFAILLGSGAVGGLSENELDEMLDRFHCLMNDQAISPHRKRRDKEQENISYCKRLHRPRPLTYRR
jgi:hypothetical protein